VCGGLVVNNKHRYVKCFIKNESYGSYKCPRAILSRDDFFKTAVGPMFKTIEHYIYSLLSENKKFYFIKNIPFHERAAYLESIFSAERGFVDRHSEFLRRFLITDFSAFESSFRARIMENCEFVMYEFVTKYLPGRDIFMRNIQTLLGENFLIFSSYVAKVLSKRMSGEMNTSLGNGFSNLMLICFCMFEQGIYDFDVIVEGDDSLCSYLGPILDSSLFEKLGFIIKFKYVSSASLASFCGQIFVPTTHVVITDPIKFLLNFPWMSIKYRHHSDKVKLGLYRGKALCALYQYSGCPIVQTFAVRVLQLTEGYDVVLDKTMDSYHLQLHEYAYSHDIQARPVTPAIRELMFLSFGIEESVQLRFEEVYSRMGFDDVHNPLLKLYVHPDTIHYFEHYVVRERGVQ